MSALEIRAVSKSYPGPGGDVVIVDEASLEVAEGEFVCLVGHSGCGKSTLLAIVAGLVRQTSGVVVVAGREVVGPGPDRGMVFQSPCLLPWLNVLDNVQLGVDALFRAESAGERRARAVFHLERLGLGDALSKRPAELSAGMRQRVGLARAFALSPKLLLLDEPFGMLDSITRSELQALLLDLEEKERTTTLMVTHDVDEALLLSDRVALMTDGPRARIGEIVTVPFANPRSRAELEDRADYLALRARILNFLERQTHAAAKAA